MTARPSEAHHVLVIEDEPQLRTMLTDNLEFEGYRVTAVASGEAGLSACDRHGFSVLLLDLMLPGISGFEVCARLRGRARLGPLDTASAASRPLEVLAQVLQNPVNGVRRLG